MMGAWSMHICLSLPSTTRKFCQWLSLFTAQTPGKRHFDDETLPHIKKVMQSLLQQIRQNATLKSILCQMGSIQLLCASKYPTRKLVLPVYIKLIQHLQIVQQGLYNQEQLIISAHEMIEKFDHYLKDAIHKPIYNGNDIGSHKTHSGIPTRSLFKNNMALPLHMSYMCSATQRKNKSFFKSALYRPAPSINGIPVKIQHYLRKDPEPKGTKPLAYWAAHQNQFPLLSTMAHIFLVILGTSA
ncbi:uncharacterized protein VP01_657g10 [Puccinia sorghi]|uniref:HAT C-terminal dimerisation domain-containing protein n=1 Tax=Puccinia sorghi TaxID=27349 RepID=A0A0L6UG53_9BASI|nr:uncharacterized protein VP01_657g10 [Puccinia sorghi]